MGKPPPLAVRLAKALPFQRARVERRDVLAAHDDLHTADGARARVAVVSGHTVRQGRRYDTYATAEGGVQGLQALSPRHWPPLGAFIKLPALRVVHDCCSCIAPHIDATLEAWPRGQTRPDTARDPGKPRERWQGAQSFPKWWPGSVLVLKTLT